MNVEHLLDVFTSIDANSEGVWDACRDFVSHLHWHKPRLVTLGPKIEGLPDDHSSKPQCLLGRSLLFDSVGNDTESVRLLICALELWREREDDFRIAEALRFLSQANGQLDLYREGIRQAKEALEIYERLNHIIGQAQCWRRLAQLLFDDELQKKPHTK